MTERKALQNLGNAALSATLPSAMRTYAGWT